MGLGLLGFEWPLFLVWHEAFAKAANGSSPPFVSYAAHAIIALMVRSLGLTAADQIGWDGTQVLYVS